MVPDGAAKKEMPGWGQCGGGAGNEENVGEVLRYSPWAKRIEAR